MLSIVNNTTSNGIPSVLNRGADANPVNGTHAGFTPAGIDKGYRSATEAATPEVATSNDWHDADRKPLAKNGTALEPVVSGIKQSALRLQEALSDVKDRLQCSHHLSAYEHYATATNGVVEQLKKNGKGLSSDCEQINSLRDAHAALQISAFLEADDAGIEGKLKKLMEFNGAVFDISAVLDQTGEGLLQRRRIDAQGLDSATTSEVLDADIGAAVKGRQIDPVVTAELLSAKAITTGQGNLADIWAQLSGMIDETKKANLDDYASAVDRYTSMYQSISDILTALSSWVTAEGSDKMKVNFKEIKKTLESLLKKYDPPGTDQIIAGTPTKGLTKADAEAICEKLGLDLKCCYKNPDGTYCVIPDLSQIHTMVNNLPGDSDNYEISVVSYNAWKSGFDAQVNRIEEALQTRGQKYGNSFSRFENFHKTISSIIQAMADMLAKFLQF